MWNMDCKIFNSLTDMTVWWSRISRIFFWIVDVMKMTTDDLKLLALDKFSDSDLKFVDVTWPFDELVFRRHIFDLLTSKTFNDCYSLSSIWAELLFTASIFCWQYFPLSWKSMIHLLIIIFFSLLLFSNYKTNLSFRASYGNAPKNQNKARLLFRSCVKIQCESAWTICMGISLSFPGAQRRSRRA